MKKSFLLLVATLCGMVCAHAVTFNVRVPAGTQQCYVCGSFNSWNADEAPQLEPAGENLFTLTLPDVASVSGGYKYLCGRGWDYVEKDASGGEVSNRTSIGSPDVVGSWYHVPDYSVDKAELVINGIKRLVKVYVPDGYEDSTESYPVIYYNTVQQRYNDAGSDSDAGDDFFAANSWHAQTTMESLRAQGGQAYVMVQVCSFLAENTPQAIDDFIGTGAAAEYLDAFTSELMPYVQSHYRVLTGADATVLVGADYAALFSLYAALEQPQTFGTCVAMSPMLWANPGAFDAMLGKAASGQRFYLCAGSLEPEWMITQTRALADTMRAAGMQAYYTECPGAIHTDDAWGASFGTILQAVSARTAPAAVTPKRPSVSKIFDKAVYTLYGGTDKNNLQRIGTLTYLPEYFSGKAAESVPAMAITNVIPASVKSTYYWNIAKGADSSAGWLLDAAKSVGFSSKKSAESWHNIAVFEDESSANVAAHSRAFSVVAGSDKIPMTFTEGFKSQATVSFPSANKTFTIHYGSVNSGSDMGAITQTYTVSPDCTEAEITYDFNSNSVSIKEIGSGQSEPEIDFKDRVYTLYGGETAGSLTKVGQLTYTDSFRPKDSSAMKEAFVITADVPASVKGTYYYNIAKGADSSAGWLMTTDLSVGFKSSKTETSWLRVALTEDGNVSSIAANSRAFRIITSSSSELMQTGNDHTTTATVKFPGSDKSFTINYGSVNTGTDMGAMTPSISVSESCIEADVVYDFTLNSVTITETKQGQSLDDISIIAFTATPSVCHAGTAVDVTLELSEPCEASISCTRDFTDSVALNIEQLSGTSYKTRLLNPSEGVYTFTLGIALGNNSISDAAEINVRVLPADTPKQKKLSVNAYDNVDWALTGRYKANFHTHTSQSFDTQYSTTHVVDSYQAAGYKILALTDHDANSYPWQTFSLYNPQAADRDPEAMGMLAIPGVELSKDRRNSWSESTGGDFNHHNDFFTGRKGQEFMSLRESYAYTHAIGGLQIINHPGQYWNISTSYAPGAKNSPEWHAENFRLYPSLIGFEVYNQGNRRPNDRILWDQVLTINMPDHPVWGYSCDDTHTAEQYFRNYQFMLMDALSVDALKDAMRCGRTVFSYEYTGSGQDLAPHISHIAVDHENKTITIESPDADRIEWISSTHRTVPTSPASTRSTVVGIGKTFPFRDFQGSYVRARLVNGKGETATQPFGFTDSSGVTSIPTDGTDTHNLLTVDYDALTSSLTVACSEPMQRVSVVNAAGMLAGYVEALHQTCITVPCAGLASGVHVVVVATERAAYTAKFVK